MLDEFRSLTQLRQAASVIFVVVLVLGALTEVSPLNLRLYRSEEQLALQAISSFGPRGTGVASFSDDYVPEAHRSAQMERLLREHLAQVGTADQQMRLVSLKAAISDPYRMPLRKSGTCRFVAQFEKAGTGPSIGISGQLQTTAVGILSGRGMKRHMGEKIGRSVRRYIGRELAQAKSRKAERSRPALSLMRVSEKAKASS